MKKFNTLSGIVAPLDRDNVDTDQIIPKQFLKSIRKSGFGPNLFDSWRYLDQGEPHQDAATRETNPDFILNQEPYQNSCILLSRKNFGCGSSREHAVWALADFGIYAVLASSYADIFFGNCGKNGVLALVLSEERIEQLFQLARSQPIHMTIDLQAQSLASDSHDLRWSFEVDPELKQRLLEGLDDIAMTMQHKERIVEFERERQQRYPWVFRDFRG